MSFQISVSISFSSVFDWDKTLTPEYFLRNISKVNALHYFCFFLKENHSNERDENKQKDLLEIWLKDLPENIAEKSREKVNEIKKSNDFNFINNKSGLYLINEIIKSCRGDKKMLENEDYLNLYKAYLLCTEKWQEEQEEKALLKKPESESEVRDMILSAQTPLIEINELKDFRIQFLKSSSFFKFCEKNDDFKDFLNTFLSDFDFTSYNSYLELLLSIYSKALIDDKNSHHLVIEDGQEAESELLDYLSVDPEKFEPSEDFLNLRKTPLFKIKENEYIILSLNFFVDKIFHAAQFDMANSLIKNKTEYKGKRIRDIPHFLSIIGSNFSENLFFEILNDSFINNNYLMADETTLGQYINESRPDFYIRDKAKIYLFEFKDTKISQEAKTSFNHQVIKEELFRKFFINDRGNDKGVNQILNNINNIFNGIFNDFDPNIPNNNQLIIYPILVVTDPSLSGFGVNHYINQEFKEALKNKGLEGFRNIKKPIIINLDIFLALKSGLRSKKHKINNCFNRYIEMTKKSRDVYDRLMSFDNFYYEHLRDEDEFGKMLEEELPNIFA